MSFDQDDPVHFARSDTYNLDDGRRLSEHVLAHTRVSSLQTPSAYRHRLTHPNVNLPQMSFGADHFNTGGLNNSKIHPKFPSAADIDDWAALGANVYRLPVLWNWLQPDAQSNDFSASLNETIMKQMDALINHTTLNSSIKYPNNSTYVIIDLVISDSYQSIIPSLTNI